MRSIAIRAEGLGKQYRIGERTERYRTFRDAISDAVRAPIRRLRRREPRSTNIVWGLKDVGFEIKQGEIVGVIGRNGAGKSTLLKVLSRITEPTTGYVEVSGRVGCLLEVGTGFHPELTGRENIFLNGAILGMRRAAIARAFDEIVAFAEVDRFIDTPVKHYSSGMYLRLAFAVAAHLEPELLLVDEVLAVGDSAFQNKCLGKLGEVGRQGRTVLLVSHNLAAVAALCHRCIVLASGTVAHDGNVASGLRAYSAQFAPTRADSNDQPDSVGSISMCCRLDEEWDSASPLTVEWRVVMPARTRSAILWCLLDDSSGNRIFRQPHTAFLEASTQQNRAWRIRVTIPPLSLPPGAYALHLRVYPNELGRGTRFTSDPVLLHVRKAGDLSAAALLAPRLDWTVHPHI